MRWRLPVFWPMRQRDGAPRGLPWNRIFAGVGLGLVVSGGVAVNYLHSADGAHALAGYISRAASSPGMKVEIGAIEAMLSSNPVMRDIALVDRDGVWLKIDRVSAEWTRHLLLALKVDVDRLNIGEIDVLRRPTFIAAVKTAEGAAKAADKVNKAWRPELPVRLRLGQLVVGKLTLGEPLFGAPATLSLSGGAELGALRDNARIKLDARRLDAPGAISMAAEFFPDGEKLRVKITASEPAGGLVARIAKIPGLPPVEINMHGDGTLDAFEAKLGATAGESIGAEGSATITRAGAARRVNLDLSARFADMLPKDLAALFAGATTIDGVALIGDDGAETLESLALKSSAFTLDAAGKLDAADTIAGLASLHGVPNRTGAGFSAQKLEGEARIAGSLARPNATLTLTVHDAEGPFGRIGHVDFAGKTIAKGDGDAAPLEVEAQGRALDLALADAGLAEAIGDKASLSMTARVDESDVADVDLARVETGAGSVNFTGKAGAKILDGKLAVAAPDLHRFARLAKRDLRGALTIGADVSGAPQTGAVAAILNGAITAPNLGLATVDGLVGRRLQIGGKVAILPSGGVSFDKLALRGEHVTALVDGAATTRKAAINARIDLPDLRAADPRLSGRGDIVAAMTGSLDKPDATLNATILDAAANGRPIPKLALRGEAHDLVGELNALATLEGVVDGKPARGRVVAARVGKGWKVDTIDLAVGAATVKGNVALDRAGLASGRLDMSAPNLDDFSALALQKLAGRLSANVALDAVGGAQNAAVDAQGGGIAAQSASIERLNAKFTARDLYRRPMLDGDISVDNARVGKETIGKARLFAKAAGAGAAALDLTLDARGFNVASHATLTPGDATRLDIAQFSAQRAGKKIALAGPAVVTLRNGAVDLKGVAVALGSGRLDLDGTVSDRLNLVAKARAVPLSVAALVDPSLGLDGVVDAEAHITGSKSAPAGDWNVKIAKATAARLRANGLPVIDATASGRLSGQRTTVDADVALGSSSRLKIAGSAPLDEGALDLGVKGALDAALANAMLAANGQTVAGKANVDLKLSGSPASPIVGGGITVADGAFNDPLNGVALNKITGRLEGRGRDLSIASITAQTRNGGQIAVTGKVSVAPDTGMPGQLHIGAVNAQLANTDVVSSVGDLDLSISGALARNPKVAGKVTLRNMDVSVPDRIPANLKPLPGAHHIDAKRFAAQMLALERKEKAKAAKKSNFDAALDLAISAPDRIFVRGRGIDAEFGGDLKIGGTVQKPNVLGGFELRRGKLQLLTQRIDITRGKLTFTGGLTPELDFSAETQAGDVTARIGVSGPAALPGFTFSSSPELPQDEVLSRLLFAKASGALTPFQAVQLAAALAQFSGAGAGGGAFDKMRKSLGVDSLDLDAGGGNGPTVGASKYIMDGVNVGVKTGASPEQTAVGVGVDVTKRMRVQTETRSDGKTSVGVGVEWEY